MTRGKKNCCLDDFVLIRVLYILSEMLDYIEAEKCINNLIKEYPNDTNLQEILIDFYLR